MKKEKENEKEQEEVIIPQQLNRNEENPSTNRLYIRFSTFRLQTNPFIMLILSLLLLYLLFMIIRILLPLILSIGLSIITIILLFSLLISRDSNHN